MAENKKSSIINFRKVLLSEVVKMYPKLNYTVAIPESKEDIDLYRVLPTEFGAMVMSERKYCNLKHLFKCIKFCVFNGILEKELFIEDIHITDEIKSKLYLKYKDEIEVVRHIIKLGFYPLVDDIDKEGNPTQKVCSHSFENMSEEMFFTGKDKAIDWLSDVMGYKNTDQFLMAVELHKYHKDI